MSGSRSRFDARAPWLAALGLAAASACGGEAPAPVEPREPAPAPTTSGAEAPPPDDDEDFTVEGTLGTLSQQEVQDAVSRRFQGFLRCFAARTAEVELLAGEVTFGFHVVADGAVDRAALLRSTVGDRPTERCLVDEALRVRFPRPRGGSEAEVSMPFAVDLAEDLRPPVFWDAARVRTEAEARTPEAREACGAEGDYTLTAYVGPGAEVLAVGAVTPTLAGDPGTLDCLAADVAERWVMPDPGSYPAKVTFDLP